MNLTIPRILLSSLFATVLFLGITLGVEAQSYPSHSPVKPKPIMFKPPGGYMPADFPEKRAGKLLLDPKRPGGMFIVYPKDDESPDVLPKTLKSMVAGMFLHDSKTPVNWTTTALPAHEATVNETGTLYSTSNEQMELQLAVYARTVGVTKIVYGYYGMRHKTEKKNDDAPFIDSSGKGVKDFDKLWQSIKETK